LAPAGKENLFFLIPTAPGLLENEEILDRYFNYISEKTERYTGNKIKDNLIFKVPYGARNFIKDYHSLKGNAYGLANTLLQTAFLKPDAFFKRSIRIIDEGLAASETRTVIIANCAKNHHCAAGHVFTPIGAATFHHGSGAGIAHGEALTGLASRSAMIIGQSAGPVTSGRTFSSAPRWKNTSPCAAPTAAASKPGASLTIAPDPASTKSTRAAAAPACRPICADAMAPCAFISTKISASNSFCLNSPGNRLEAGDGRPS
jgi:hypothetical protein